MEEERFFSNRELYDLIQDTAREMQSLKKRNGRNSNVDQGL